MSEPMNENGHEFVTGAEVGFTQGSLLWSTWVCQQCGIVRRDDGRNGLCRGKVEIQMRSLEG
jgi:hypothetical protein